MHHSGLVFARGLEYLSFEDFEVEFQHEGGFLVGDCGLEVGWSLGFHDSLGLLEVNVSFFIHALSQVDVSGFEVDFLLFLDGNH